MGWTVTTCRHWPTNNPLLSSWVSPYFRWVATSCYSCEFRLVSIAARLAVCRTEDFGRLNWIFLSADRQGFYPRRESGKEFQRDIVGSETTSRISKRLVTDSPRGAIVSRPPVGPTCIALYRQAYSWWALHALHAYTIIIQLGTCRHLQHGSTIHCQQAKAEPYLYLDYSVSGRNRRSLAGVYGPTFVYR